MESDNPATLLKVRVQCQIKTNFTIADLVQFWQGGQRWCQEVWSTVGCHHCLFQQWLQRQTLKLLPICLNVQWPKGLTNRNSTKQTYDCQYWYPTIRRKDSILKLIQHGDVLCGCHPVISVHTQEGLHRVIYCVEQKIHNQSSGQQFRTSHMSLMHLYVIVTSTKSVWCSEVPKQQLNFSTCMREWPDHCIFQQGNTGWRCFDCAWWCKGSRIWWEFWSIGSDIHIP